MRRGVLAFLGPAGRGAPVAAAADAHGLRAVALEPDLLIFAGDRIAAASLPDGTHVLGDMFSRSGATCSTPGDGWGDFLAFSRDGSGQHVARAPLTGMPLYWTRHESGNVCGSDLELLARFLSNRDVDWEFIAQSLVHINLRTDRTGIASLNELLAGTRLDFDGRDIAVRSLWSPWDHVAKSDSRTRALRATNAHSPARLCVSRHGDPRPHY